MDKEKCLVCGEKLTEGENVYVLIGSTTMLNDVGEVITRALVGSWKMAHEKCLEKKLGD
ncbi:MAG: hypothetical protein WC449_05565 [Candidatus Paceibacterota bacterium]